MPRLHIAGIALAGLFFSTAAWAVDTPSPGDLPDLGKIRSEIKAEDYKTAIGDLQGLIDQGYQDPNIYNLLGYSLRKTGDRKGAESFYLKALDFDPNHKGTLEYQGELYIENGDLPKAKQNLARLETLCPAGCDERADLEAALTKAAGK
ncbi:tetratricopeptide repeat protein [Labrys monachus]|uniref:Flp pilus assembly protein TadD n=1 Tax=Labrys monachus TaxID=217067 RepID=A0ABU0FNY7_9HYPH|nr:tetratricopeptide repeat protein [Labrys monachus]MDQ0396246.1 Flp pilus assembly protein TadD [Labrys monachus]